MNHIANGHKEAEYVPLYDDTNFFTTYDLGATAALICSGYELMAVDKENPSKALFVFRKEDSIEETVDDYWADRLEVKARRYFDSLKAVKNKLYSSK
jgi:CTP:phosphocholine cytidylyltransferase-like protein